MWLAVRQTGGVGSTRYVALLRAINVGGTGKLSMALLREICTDCGCTDVATYIQSGNVVLTSDLDEAGLRTRLARASPTGRASPPT